MNNDLDLSDLDNFVADTIEEPKAPQYDKLQEQAIQTVQKAMKSVIQEILISLPDGSVHMCYINKINVGDKGLVEVLFSTPSESRKAELAEHVEKCVKIQFEQAKSESPKKRWYNLF